MLNQIKDFGTSGAIATIVEEVNNRLRDNDGKVEAVVACTFERGACPDKAAALAKAMPRSRPSS
jgi:hypothetical protein